MRMPGQVASQNRRLAALEEALAEAQSRPQARRRCLDGAEDVDPVATLERQLSALSGELEARMHAYLQAYKIAAVLEASLYICLLVAVHFHACKDARTDLPGRGHGTTTAC
jgi:hypothetical protein